MKDKIKFIVIGFIMMIIGIIMKESGSSPLVALIGFFLICYSMYSALKTKVQDELHGKNSLWVKDKAGFKYKHYFNKTGIAIDLDNELIHLKNANVERTYHFDDVREWSYNISSGGINYGAGGSGLQNAVAHTQNQHNSGFFVTVKDIDHPQWQIAFPYNDNMKTELLRWMEIFRQYIDK